MRPFALLLCPLVLASAGWAADPSPEPDDDNDAKKILGTWQAVKGIKRGTPATAAEIEKLRLVVKKDKLTIIEGDSPEVPLTYKLDMKAKPRAIDLTLEVGKQMTILGIYKIEKGELTIVTGEQDGVRPKAFDEKGATVLVLRKAKK